MKRYLDTLFYIVIVISDCNRSNSIESNDAIKLLDNENYFFLDVRTFNEHEKKSIPNTDCIPIQIITEKMKDLENDRNKTMIVYCRSGNRSETATKILNKNGFKAFNMIGGINGWEGEVVHN